MTHFIMLLMAGAQLFVQAAFVQPSMLVETIPRVEKEWKISFDINPHGLVSGWGSIIHLMDKSTNTGDDGGLLPGVWFRSNTTQLYVGYNLNGEHFIHFTADNSLPLNEYSTVEISQRKNNNNEYEFKCTVNGSLIPTGDGSLGNPSIASTPKEYTQVKLYASNPWSPAANAEIKNLLFQNVPTAKLVECFDFSECSATCGNGTQTCKRTCENGNFGNDKCPNDQQVNTRACNTQACPEIVDCEKFTECSASCGNGTQTCQRTCKNGNFGDVGCSNDLQIYTQTCNSQQCPEIVDCVEYSECSVTCGNGTQTCERTCSNGNFGDVGCPNDLQINTQTCNSQQCPEIVACSDYNECSVTCGSGTQTCSRTCENGNFGDVGCPFDQQLNTHACNSQACPAIVDCFDYTECSATCGNGTQTCSRTCDNGKFGDVGCPSDQQYQNRTCNTRQCPEIVDCSEYSECSATCGSGTQSCERTCENGNFGDVGCPQEEQYMTRICNSNECPQLGNCSEYTDCSGTCGGGTQTCQRLCENGSFGNVGCPTDQQFHTQSCNPQACPKVIDCSDFIECSATCGVGTQICMRTCENGNWGDDGCPIELEINAQTCNTKKCAELVPCTDYTTCSATCGRGIQTCMRACENGSWGDAACPMEQKFYTHTCNPQDCPELVDCFDYSVCSATCGSGTQTCQRTCQNGTFGDTGCPIDQEFKTRTCNSQECPQIVDCHEYTECSASCGSGTQTCSRICDNGNFGDAGCSSNDHYNTRICNEQHCNIPDCCSTVSVLQNGNMSFSEWQDRYIVNETMSAGDWQGHYILNGSVVNNRPVYVDNSGNFALWFNGESGWKAHWTLGPVSALETVEKANVQTGYIQSNQDALCPGSVTVWNEWMEEKWEVNEEIQVECVSAYVPFGEQIVIQLLRLLPAKIWLWVAIPTVLIAVIMCIVICKKNRFSNRVFDAMPMNNLKA